MAQDTDTDELKKRIRYIKIFFIKIRCKFSLFSPAIFKFNFLYKINFISLQRMTKENVINLCKKNKLYLTPYLNDVIYLHYQGIVL